MATVKLCDVIKRAHIKVDKDNTELIYYIGGEHFTSGLPIVENRGLIAGSTIGPMFYYGFKAGQFLLVSRNPHLKKAGVVDFDGICSEKTFVLETADESILLPEFLPFVLQNDRFWDYAIKNRHGSTNFFLNWSALANYTFDLPNIEEQQRLANLLWSIENTKKAYRTLISASDALIQSQFVEMFEAYMNEANSYRIDSICACFCDGDWIESKDQSDSGIRLIQTGNVGTGCYIDKGERARFIDDATFKRLNCTAVKAGDILVSRLPDPIGRACIIPESVGNAITAVDCTIIRLKENLLPEYFVAYTLTPMYAAQIDSFTTGSTRKRISRANLGSVIIPVPPTEAQKLFAAFAEQLDKSKFVAGTAEIKTRECKYKNLKQSKDWRK